MASTRISNAAAIAACDAIVDLIDAGGAGTIEIWNGTKPAAIDTSVTDNDTPYSLLAVLTFSATAFGAASDGNPGGTASANSISSDTSANKTGTASWFRVKSGAGTIIIDGDITTTGGGGDLELNSTAIQAGAEVAVSSYSFTVPESA